MQLTSTDGFVCPAYVARPEGTPRAGLVVLQEIFGINAHIRAVADGYAAQGYLVIAPATFHRVQTGVELGYTADDVATGVKLKAAVEGLPPPGVLQDVQAAVHAAAEAGPVGVVGYCWGGLLTWRAACSVSGIRAAVPYYGGGMTAPAEVARQPRCLVLAHFGDQDHAIPLEGVQAFQAAHAEVRVEIYNAQHGFNCDHRAAFDAPSAALARERTLAFFAEHLQD
ncbi:dienelactone hydrolase family protein [Rhodoferax saidenbachensis]|uniref:Carboxymethylenebutenolidase n=1 Tax=Rhodoferax saidenbachensis TaxID=1484693 RepID=A0ABU1ZMZ4_9BURK|nr:dienelactone hydrolase family protein [Rhodoferax saidenbachensis]MDR7306898.1 carboxymethylenebutenolidase [Rhodoferax saidenbachensis]